MTYEPISNVAENYINCCSPIELLQGKHDSYHVKYDHHLIFTKKDYHMLDNSSLDASAGTASPQPRPLK